MVRPLVYSKRTTEAEKKAKRRAAQQRWMAKNHEMLLRKKREWARRPEALARRRELYRLRKEGAGNTGQHECLLEPPVPRPLTLDDFAKREAPVSTNEDVVLLPAKKDARDRGRFAMQTNVGATVASNRGVSI